MSRWRSGAAVLVVWAAAVAPAWAQCCNLMPTPYGAARFSDPIPMATGNCPDLVPGPITPAQLPPGPDESHSLSAGVTNAFPDCEPYAPDCGIYVHFGTMALERKKFGNQPLAVLDPQNLDTGVHPPTPSPVILDGSNLGEFMHWGGRGTLGVQWENHAFEVSGWGVVGGKNAFTRTMPGQIDVLASTTPFGFSGDNGLFLQADRARIEKYWKMYGAEVNYRVADPALTDFELIVGARFIYLNETFTLSVDDDAISAPRADGTPDPLRQAVYRVESKNFIVAPQLGFEWSHCTYIPGVTAGITGKGAWGLDFPTYHNQLTRGDGFNGFSKSNNATAFTHVYEVGAFVDFHLLERMRVRAGYQALWLLNVANVQDQIELNFGNTEGPRKTTGDLFFHGPLLEIQLYF
jgi:hypothetical protein